MSETGPAQLQLSIYRRLIHPSPAPALPILIHCDVRISPDAQMSQARARRNILKFISFKGVMIVMITTNILIPAPSAHE